MELGAFAKTFMRPTLEDTLDEIKALELTQVQFNMSCLGLATLPDRLEESSCIWIARALAERGLTMAAVSGTFNLCDPNPSRLEHNLRRLDILAAACRWLDTRVITICTGTRNAQDMWSWHPDNGKRSSWNDLVANVREAVKIADRHEVTLAFEPELSNVVDSVIKARRLLDEIDSRWLKVVLDPANLISTSEVHHYRGVLAEAFDWLGTDIILVQAKPLLIEKNSDFLYSWSGFVSPRTGNFLNVIYEEMIKSRQEPAAPGDDDTSDRFLILYYFQLLSGLRQLGYDGPVILHGVPEEALPGKLNWLRAALSIAMSEE
jgi:sugar phosphate isomerase/epimerase